MDQVGVPLSANDPGSQKAATLTKSVMWRKRFSDITNITSIGRSEPDGQENPNLAHTKSAKDCIAMLLKENNALMKLVEERSKITEMSGIELQKLKASLQKANQQNWQLAQANSHMMAELNLSKDRLKALQHELGCTVAALRAKTLELQEEKKLNKQYKKLADKIRTESHLKPNESMVEPSQPPNCKKPADFNRKRALRSRSLGPATLTRQETAKEKDEGRRKSYRRACNEKTELCEPAENLFEIEDLKLSSPMPNPSAGMDQCFSPRHQNQGLQRSSIGRPIRRATEKVNSYKEPPLNVKLRREE